MEVIKFTQDFDKDQINIYLIGSLVPQEIVDNWHEKLKVTKKMVHTKLLIFQSSDQGSEQTKCISGEVKFGILF